MSTETKKTLAERLLLVQTKLKAPKGQYNTFGKYHYRNCEDILEAIKPLLEEQRLMVTLHDDIEQIGDRYYVKASAKIWDIDGNENDWFASWAYAREEELKKGMDSAQITGSTSSYARKYALNGLFCIDDTKDADTDEQHNEVQNRPYVPPDRKEVPGPTENQKDKIRELSEKLKLAPDSVEERIKGIATTSDAFKAISKLQEMVNAGKEG